MPENEEGKLAIYDIKKHSFESAKKSLQQYAEEHHETSDLMTVPSDGGLFGWFDHKVTGDELNQLTSQIQDQLVRINRIHQGVFTELVQVYKALDALDKDYIFAIVDSIKATEEVNRKAKKNRQDIEDSVANQEKMIEVLKGFKKKLEKLEHLTDVDKAWKMLSEQQEAILLLNHFKEELTQIEHLDDVDTIWEHQNETDDQISELKVNLAQTEDTIKAAEENLTDLVAFREELERTQHLWDIDSLFNEIAGIKKDVSDEKKSLKTLSSDFKAQQHKVEATEGQIESQAEALSRLSSKVDENIKAVEASMEKAKETINKIENEISSQKKLIEETKAEIEDCLSTLEQNSAKEIDELRNSLTHENESLTARCEDLTRKIKFAFMASGVAVAIAAVHFVLNIIGVL